MAILKTDPYLFAARKFAEKRVLRLKIDAQANHLIRKLFDKASNDYEALASIELAKEYGFSLLAQEMQEDFSIETDQNIT